MDKVDASVIHSSSHYFAFAPFWTICAGGFYLAIVPMLVLCMNKPIRDRVGRFFLFGTGPNYYPTLDSFRGLAAVWVASWHQYQYLGAFSGEMSKQWAFKLVGIGYLGVPVFVLLSGFLIYGVAKRSLKKLDDLRNFYFSRFLRIYPLYFTTVLVLASMHLIPSFGMMLADILMLKTIRFPYYTNPIAWSLYVEEAFYLLIPCWVATVRRNALVAAAALVLIFVLSNYFQTENEYRILHCFFLGFLFFEWNSLLRQWQVGRPQAFKAGIWFSFAAGMIVLVPRLFFDGVDLGHWILGEIKMIPNSFSELSVPIGFGFLIVASFYIANLSRVFSWFPFRFLGAISYSLFLWHGILIIADTTHSFRNVIQLKGTEGYLYSDCVTLLTLNLPCAIFIATGSFVLIERPFLNMKKRFQQKSLGVARQD